VKFILRFDEFFKLLSRVFFESYGLTVETEVEIFKLPKKLDVLVVKTEKSNLPKIRRDFKTLDYFNEYNIISFKSIADRAKPKDILDCLIYLAGYINLEKAASLDNTTITLVVNHIPQAFFQKYKQFINEIDSGKYKIEMNLLKIMVLDLSKIEFRGIDSDYLLEAGPSERLQDLLKNLESNSSERQKVMDKLMNFLYFRYRNFEKNEFPGKFMPKVLEADITEWVKPHYDKGLNEGLSKGRQEGTLAAKLEDASRLLALGVSLDIVIKATGLTREQLRKAKII